MGGYNVVPSAIQRRIMGLGVSPDEEDERDPNEIVQDPDFEEALSAYRPSDPTIGQNSSADISAVTPQYGPESKGYLEKLHQIPQRSDYKPSMLRRVVGGLSGALAGVGAGSGEEGVKAALGVRDYPFARAMSDYQRNLESQKEASGVETGQIGTQTKAQEAIANRKAAEERAAQYRANAERFRYMTSPEYFQHQLELKKAGIRPGALPKTLVPLGAGGLYNADTGETIPPVRSPHEPTNEFELWHSQNPDAPAESYPGLKRSVGEYADFKEGYLQKHPGANSTEVVTAYAAAHEAPQRIPPITGFSGGRVVALRPGQEAPKDFQTGTQAGQVNTPTAFFRGRQESAGAAIEAGNNLIKFVNENKDSLGNVDNYWKALLQGTPVSDPTVAHFIGQVQSWAALQGAAHGMRSGTIMKEFEDRIGKGPKNPEAVIAAIQGVNEGLSSVANAGGTPSAPQTSSPSGVPKPGETFNGSKVKSVKQIK